MKIIVADDDKDLERMARRLYARRGYTDVKFILTVAAAIEGIKADQPDVVLLDINFEEDFDGFHVLRETKPFCPNTKFIMSSAYAEFRDKALAAGADAYNLKPTNINDLFKLFKGFENGSAIK